uniref:Uncharacterized protein n=1 Tax=Aegilops tauschii subsp. strangulata TaxID=200361 RepID=A0A452YFY6_AEGTS
LGGDSTLKILFMKLIQACGSGAEQNQNWQPLEAALFCIQAIAKSVSIEEKEILPQVLCHCFQGFLTKNSCYRQFVQPLEHFQNGLMLPQLNCPSYHLWLIFSTRA